ncbi:hypothetical protein EDF46_3342 [Frondihabitans sp. PhB188]|uniref:DUF7882 family protein n=1 Tax=Frondihabitans sp. PhB188 TaxID=2485200 RepID=UPI000F491110|nr:hypothetical protein [Frondihabitans sp. PhB188]ROQ36794.1 hypothetical protein EDF46_3342 [Frondihabitans sp. PhB188]
MGTLFYGDNRFAIGIDDRALAHLQLVILAKLRRNESFSFTWQKGADGDAPQSTIWLHPSIPLNFDYENRLMPSISRAWIEILTAAANSNPGLALIPEPQESQPDHVI